MGGLSTKTHIVLTGLDGAGKTTLLWHLKAGKLSENVVTIGVMNETASLSAFPFSVTNIDLGGRGKIRYILRHYYQSCKAVIFVVDSRDTDRMTEDKYEGNSAELHLKQLAMEEELRGKPFLLVLTKSDLAEAAPAELIIRKLHLEEVLTKGQYHVVQTNMKDGFRTVVEDGLPWLERRLRGLPEIVTNNNAQQTTTAEETTTNSLSASTKVDSTGGANQTKTQNGAADGQHKQQTAATAPGKLWSIFKKIL